MHELAKRLIDSFRVIVLCPHAAGASTSELFDGVEVVRYRYGTSGIETLVNDGGIVTNIRRSRWKALLVPGFVLAQAFHAWRIIRREAVDVVHAHWLVPQGFVIALLQFLPGITVPFVATSHGADLFALRGKILERIKRFVIERASASTVVSSVMKQMLADAGADQGKVRVQPMGVDLVRRFTVDPKIERSSDHLLFVGRLVEKKGLGYLLEAMPRILQKRPAVHLTVAGFGPEELALRRQAVRLGIDSRITFLGAVPQEKLPRLYRKSALFVAPFVRATSGDQEGLGLVLVEAIGCGCPVLAGNVPAARDVLGDWPELLVDPSDAAALSISILGLLESAERARSHGDAIRERTREKFNWDGVASEYERILLDAACLRSAESA
ncbi:glycosyltransferase [Luteimonas sp. A501]